MTRRCAGSLWVVEWGDTYDHSLAGRLRPDSRPDLDGGARLRRTHLETPRSVSRSGGVNALPRRGYLSRADREREEEESFVAARRAHPAIESAINGLEHRGLDRIRSHGADGFARTVALSVLAANLHRIGLILQKRERKRQRLVA